MVEREAARGGLAPLADEARASRAALGQLAQRLLWLARRGFGRVDRRLARDYLASPGERRLHLGCGLHPLPGWLNSDLFPTDPGILHLDAGRRFPFADAQFDWIYSEHLIEHLNFTGGARQLAECRRVLRPGGRLRIATPDLAFLIALHRDAPGELERAYVERATALYYPSAAAPSPTFAINNFFRNWGHRFLYDEPTLRAALDGAGFCRVERVELGQSEHAVFRGLENEDRLPAGFLRLETLVLEAAASGDSPPPG
jgi:predicted SAM-dependent methyltransferase